MPLTLGTTLGPYQVTAKIGEGGMGEVWQARDTKPDRDVALQVLPEAFTSDPDRLARFEREAKVPSFGRGGATVLVTALPNIAAACRVASTAHPPISFFQPASAHKMRC